MCLLLQTAFHPAGVQEPALENHPRANPGGRSRRAALRSLQGRNRSDRTLPSAGAPQLHHHQLQVKAASVLSACIFPPKQRLRRGTVPSPSGPFPFFCTPTLERWGRRLGSDRSARGPVRRGRTRRSEGREEGRTPLQQTCPRRACTCRAGLPRRTKCPPGRGRRTGRSDRQGPRAASLCVRRARRKEPAGSRPAKPARRRRKQATRALPRHQDFISVHRGAPRDVRAGAYTGAREAPRRCPATCAGAPGAPARRREDPARPRRAHPLRSRGRAPSLPLGGPEALPRAQAAAPTPALTSSEGYVTSGAWTGALDHFRGRARRRHSRACGGPAQSA